MAVAVSGSVKKSGFKLLKSKKILFLFLGLFLGFAYIFPIYILALNSFKTQNGLFSDILGVPNAETFTLKNYSVAFKELNFFKAFSNSLFITVCSVVLILLVSSMAAWVLVRYKSKISKVIFFTFAASMLIPFQCVMLPLLKVATRFGLLNPFGLIFMYIGFGVSMSSIIIHGFVKNIPEELEEAAVIDGCGFVRTFFVVVLPLLRVILITVAVLNIMWIWNDYLLPNIVLSKNADWSTLPLMTYKFFAGFSKRWDVSLAALVICMTPVIVFYFWSQRYIISGITDGSIK